ncbi:MAG: ABC transporter permease [Dehalococcoidales bacterium]|nr:ABC transporter permease [Dehalococcoidales bacterium]
MISYVIRRLVQAVVVLILVTLIVFFVVRLLPGDPLTIYMAQSAQQMSTMPPEKLAQLRADFGLDKPIMVQYLNWVADMFRGDFGTSVFFKEDVGKLMLERFPVTIHLGVVSVIVGSIFGILAGMLAAVRRGNLADRIVTPLTYVGITIPAFLLGILLIYLFGVKLHWLPIQGYTSPLEDFWLNTRQLVMPVICMVVFGMAANARQVRSSMLEVIRQDYIRTAWSKGLTEGNVIIRHALKNSLIPVITMIGLGIGGIFAGSVLIETVFAIPGIGRLLVSSIFSQDYVVVQAITLVISLAVLLSNLIVDISYAWLDPRIRYG